MSTRKRWLLVFAFGGYMWAQNAAPVFPEAASLTPTAQSGPPTIASGAPPDPRNLLPDLPAIPRGDITLIGGTIRGLDRVRDRITIQVFGGAKAVVLFDPRTHFYREGTAATAHDLAPGQKVYIDTMLDGTSVFARNIRIVDKRGTGQSGGQIVAHEAGSSELTVRDVLSAEPLELLLDNSSVVIRDRRQVSADELVRGALVSIDFRAGQQGKTIVRQITILAVPGSTFSFDGQVAHLDISRGLVVLVDPRDQRSYEIHCEPTLLRAHPDLHEGAQVSVGTIFDGSQYTAKSLSVLPDQRK